MSSSLEQHPLHALIMGEVGARPAQLGVLNLVENTGYSRSALYTATATLFEEDLLAQETVTNEEESRLRGRPPIIYTPTSLFWQNYKEVETAAPSLLSEPAQIVHHASIMAKATLIKLDGQTAEKELLDHKIKYLGGVAVLGENYDLAQVGEWWTGSAGWQALVDIQAAAAAEHIHTDKPLTVGDFKRFSGSGGGGMMWGRLIRDIASNRYPTLQFTPGEEDHWAGYITGDLRIAADKMWQQGHVKRARVLERVISSRGYHLLSLPESPVE